MNDVIQTIIEWAIRIGVSIAILLVARWLSGLFYKAFIKFTEKTSVVSVQYRKTMRTLFNLAFYALAAFIIISVLFKNLAPVLAGLGVSGIIVGLAVKEPLENLISGILIMINKLIYEGEAVDIGGTSGGVQEIKLNHVLIKTWDGKLVTIPSKNVWAATIIHFWPENIRRNDLNVGVSYSSDLNKVMKILEEAVNSYEKLYVDDNHKPMIQFTGYGASSIDFVVRFWVEKANFVDSSTELAKIIKSRFDENGIEIPFSQLDLHIKDGPIEGIKLSNKERDAETSS
ncbi:MULTISPECIES: mechanosensitive ion channel domain-containing protein [Mesotoga]|uniref:mechanosensitive ion channel family protein n=1 Tax=Mesotoga TaxID=1184396 RepID=UPI000EF140F3|nr:MULTISPECIES: mechanosensitive ion channel domain-containing protein [Mesotoga]MCB1223845.1 mechanosensitive ion channel [Mesotoga sp.]RLL92585.1 mechanosensitive ion channel protein MscS [Mesotoga sp. HF07.pep.5.2.highcov]HPE54480.1 mechanosensitive ion channel [Mesotoga prima]HQC15955.1 mechanosensitive ion channel [Mesotoga prima]HRX66645.1 mechanosensitive ion channel [Mesotoga sp.]